MELVMFHPKAKDEKAEYIRRAEPKLVLFEATNAVKAAALRMPKGLFRKRLNGSSKLNFIAASLMKAAIEPVKVMPPIRVPRYAAILCRVSMS